VLPDRIDDVPATKPDPFPAFNNFSWRAFIALAWPALTDRPIAVSLIAPRGLATLDRGYGRLSRIDTKCSSAGRTGVRRAGKWAAMAARILAGGCPTIGRRH